MKPRTSNRTIMGFHPDAAANIIYSGLCDLDFWDWSSLEAPFWRLYWNDHPGASLHMGKRSWKLDPHTIFLIPPHTKCSCSNTAKMHHLFIHFNLPWIYLPTNSVPLAHPLSMEERALIRSFNKCCFSRPANQSVKLSLLSHTLVQLSLQHVPDRFFSRNTTDERIAKSLALLQRLHPQPVDNARLAHAAGLSLGAFVRQFKQVTGESPGRYQIHQRLSEACRLMHLSAMSLEAIAERTGFYDRFHFSRTFKRFIQRSPAEFRKQCIPDLGGRSPTG